MVRADRLPASTGRRHDSLLRGRQVRSNRGELLPWNSGANQGSAYPRNDNSPGEPELLKWIAQSGRVRWYPTSREADVNRYRPDCGRFPRQRRVPLSLQRFRLSTGNLSEFPIRHGRLSRKPMQTMKLQFSRYSATDIDVGTKLRSVSETPQTKTAPDFSWAVRSASCRMASCLIPDRLPV